MKINQIISETTTSGAVAPVSQSFVKMQTRNPVVSSKKGNNLLTGKKTKKPYMNSLDEGKTEKVEEAKLEEDDIIVVPGHSGKRKSGFVARGQSRVDHEVEMARSDILATLKNAKALYKLLQHRSEEEGLEGWVQEKIIKANDYLNAVKEYYDEKMMQQESTVLDEKAVSKKQQRFMGMVHAAQKGEKPASKEVAKVAKTMPKKAAKDFAKTKHKGLPEKVKK